jgi:hypothetical protein
MNFPLDNPIYRFLYWFVNTPGVGGAGVLLLVAACLGSFAAALRWIARGAQADEPASYAYPTSALHDHQ